MKIIFINLRCLRTSGSFKTSVKLTADGRAQLFPSMKIDLVFVFQDFAELPFQFICKNIVVIMAFLKTFSELFGLNIKYPITESSFTKRASQLV